MDRQDFESGQQITFAEVPEEFKEVQEANKETLGVVYPLFVWKVETVNAHSIGDAPIQHHQRLIISRVFDGEVYVCVDGIWMLEDEYKLTYPTNDPEVRWWSGFWFKTV